MTVITVSTAKELTDALVDNGLTPTPLPESDSITIGELTILRDVRETSFHTCEHAISTTRFAGELDWCEVCQATRQVS